MTQSQLVIEGFFDEATSTVSYLVMDAATRKCAIIDSVLDYSPNSGRTRTTSADKIIARVAAHQAQIEWILETHVHADHLSAAPYLRDKLGGKIGIGEHVVKVQHVFSAMFNAKTEFRCDGSQFDHLFHDGERFQLGQLTFQVMHTPGHTPACLAYSVEDALFVGDTLFMPDYGTARCDFPGGDAHQLYRSVRKLLALPPQTRIFLCHDYSPGGRRAIWETTVAAQRTSNVHIHEGVTEAEFVALRTARDKTLDVPVLMLPSVQVNMRAGHLPPTEDNGTHYLKIPLNKL